jgi:hypothetical protein
MRQGQDAAGQYQSVSRIWRPAAFGGIALSMVGFYEPVKDLYLKVNDPDYQGVRSVRFAERQAELADQNAVCFLEMQRAKVQVNDSLAISYGACPNSHVYVGVYPKGKSAYQRWLEPSQNSEARTASLFPAAHAGFVDLAQAITASPSFIPAQTILKTVCQDWHNSQRTKLVRITEEAGQCYFERVNVLSGVIEVRETVPCDQQCQVAAKTFN